MLLDEIDFDNIDWEEAAVLTRVMTIEEYCDYEYTRRDQGLCDIAKALLERL